MGFWLCVLSRVFYPPPLIPNPLDHSCRSLNENNHEIMEFFISKGAAFDLIDKDGVTPLMSAASQGQVRDRIVTKLLLDAYNAAFPTD